MSVCGCLFFVLIFCHFLLLLLSWFLSYCFHVCISFCLCRHKLLQVPTNRGPPEPMVQQGKSAADSRVAGQGGRVSPLQDIRACDVRHVHPVGGRVLRWRLPRDLSTRSSISNRVAATKVRAGSMVSGVCTSGGGAWSRDRASGLPFLEPGR